MGGVSGILKSKKTWIAAPILALVGGYALLRPTETRSEVATAGVILSKMNPDHHYAFMAGIVEGLAHARYIQDGKRQEGRDCIYNWFYKKKGVEEIYEAFRLYPDAMPGDVVGVLTTVECGA